MTLVHAITAALGVTAMTVGIGLILADGYRLVMTW